MSYNFLLISWGTSGNLNPLLTAARLLRQRGHRIRVMADPAMRDEVAAADFEFVTWRRAPTGREADPVDFTDIIDCFRRALIDPAAAYAADVRDEIGRAATDAVLTIDILFGAALGAEAAGVPYAMLSPHVSLRPLAGVPPASTGMSAPRTPEERTEVAAASGQFAEVFNALLPGFNDACARFGVTRLPHMLDIFDRPARVLLAMSQAFDFKADWLPDNVRYVGPLLDQPSWSGPWRAPWSAGSNRPRVLIACSTGAQGQGELFQRVIHAMGQLDIEAVATAGPNLDIDMFHAPDNVRLLRSAPHDTVMSEVSLVISQGGHGTVNRALIHALPLLVLPMGRDQGDNAARVEAKGAGLRLSPDASETEIASAAARLILDPQFGFCARRLGNAIKIDIDSTTLVREMEAVAAMGCGGRMAAESAARARSARRANRRQPAA
ncbi:MAG: glycosyltransferase [Bradyrhizobium sp.]|uniref:glycosyltransferase n=1 Tax=Bradyrhizobium sp. TaxID=376 RepID=UPI001DB12B17|nr:nucleotide disphospho-sugar-binding domain-containing protein [Bradyrhizobium sp.]MBV9563363.1 glycosyltransferase [Bradyrhizobium sp.]